MPGRPPHVWQEPGAITQSQTHPVVRARGLRKSCRVQIRRAVNGVDSPIPVGPLLVCWQYDVGAPTWWIEEIAVVIVSTGMNPKRVARPVVMNATDRPASDDVTGYPGLYPATIFPKGEIVNPGEFEVLWMVKGRDRLLTVSVVEILCVHVVVANRCVGSRQRLGEGVSGRKLSPTEDRLVTWI